MNTFAVETVELDLPPLVGALAARLNSAGVAVPPERAADLARALTLVLPVSRTRLYWTARAVIVTDRSQVPAFDGVFFSVFGGIRREVGEAPLSPGVITEPDQAPPTGERRQERESDGAGMSAGAWTPSRGRGETDDEREPVDVPVPLASLAERLGSRSFDSLDPGELAELHRLMSRIRLAPPRRVTRRHRRSRRGRHIDMRRTLRRSLHTGGDPVRLARRRRRELPRRLVMLCDISGSMEPYARAYLQFLTCATACGPNAEAFAFATRLTRLTRALAAKNPERAMRQAAAAAPDWSSGTRIGDSLKAFNDLHGRRGMARGGVVVVLSDGWDRGDPAVVDREMERLARLAHRIVWVNPRVGSDSFAPRAAGMVAALPHCDALVSGHSYAALAEVVAAIAATDPERPGLDVAPDPVAAPEPWASATPVPGSSVAMPSGHGPSRGHTTPGWITDEESS